MLVWYDVIFVLRVERLVLGWDIDFLRCKVRATIKFLGYFRDWLLFHRETGQKERDLQMGLTGASWAGGNITGEARGIYLEKVREAGLF